MPASATRRPEKLPALLDRKLYKTGQTRGATVREIYQNRVSRNSTVLIPWGMFDRCRTPDDGTETYENGFIVLIEPTWYFGTAQADETLAANGVELGVNAVLLFQKRGDWSAYGLSDGQQLSNGKVFAPAIARQNPLGGTYIARVHSTTAGEGGEAIVRGFTTTSLRGAGIRVYEYANSTRLYETRLQLEALVWLCHDSVDAMAGAGMTRPGAEDRIGRVLEEATLRGLLDLDRLNLARMIDDGGRTVCPLCLDRISASDFLKREGQAEGRETWDNTITELSLFHIEELRVGRLSHKPYNLGWGHHFCNVVVKDAGIIPTLRWMKRVLDNNGDSYEAIAHQEELIEEAVEQ
ncbi:hypothetical protein J3D45_002930 [Microbacterium foliorum]|uniref:BstXI family restriction endonuclease n=1 Tax=Microbacterium foliorum TaxID=104336 RepID=UPI00209DA9AF|nr:BstXI family restriction endonuclease [Microbacterium foliorum]MCP1430432.1 hypothetical protein [Microbacterium foliorum]